MGEEKKFLDYEGLVLYDKLLKALLDKDLEVIAAALNDLDTRLNSTLTVQEISIGSDTEKKLITAAVLNEAINTLIGNIQTAAGANINSVGTPSVSASTSNGVTTLTFNYLKGATGSTGATGVGISSISRTSGNGSAGTTDTYTITGTNNSSLGTFTVYNGDDGSNGNDGYTPYINSSNYHWMINGSDTGVVALGQDGTNGTNGTSAGFGTPTATIDSNTGTPSVTVTASGSNTAKVFNFAFTNLKGESGTSSVWFTGTAVTGTSSSGISASVSNSKAGDMYLNTSTYNVYKATAANTWGYVCNIKGTDGTNATTTSVFTSSANGLAPAASNTNKTTAETTLSRYYLCDDGKYRQLPANAFNDTTYSTMGASGSSHASGLVPDPGSTQGTTKFLREDGTWVEPSSAPTHLSMGQGFGICETAASQWAKTVSLPGFVKTAGGIVSVLFVNGHSNNEMTININNTGQHIVLNTYNFDICSFSTNTMVTMMYDPSYEENGTAVGAYRVLSLYQSSAEYAYPVTGLAGLSWHYNFQIATISTNQSSVYISGAPKSSDPQYGTFPPKGKEVHVIVHATADVSIVLPTSSPYILCSKEDTLSLSNGDYAEINFISDGTNVYVRAIA